MLYLKLRLLAVFYMTDERDNSVNIIIIFQIFKNLCMEPSFVVKRD